MGPASGRGQGEAHLRELHAKLLARRGAAANRRIQRTQEEDATTVRRGQPAVAQNDPISCYGKYRSN